MTETAADFLGVDTEFLKRVLPIARSDRRENDDLFFSWISSLDARDDALFYPALKRILIEDLDIIRQYDARQAERNKPQKCFGIRIRKYIATKHLGTYFKDILSIPDDYFPAFSSERSLHILYRKLYMAELTEMDEPDNLSDADSAGDWKVLVDAIADIALGMEEPDVASATALRQYAESLERLCGDLTRAGARAREAEERRAALIVRLIELAHGSTISVPTAIPEGTGHDRLDTLEKLVSDLEQAFVIFREKAAAYDVIKASYRSLVDNDDFDGADALMPLQRQAIKDRDEARHSVEDLAAALTDRIAASSFASGQDAEEGDSVYPGSPPRPSLDADDGEGTDVAALTAGPSLLPDTDTGAGSTQAGSSNFDEELSGMSAHEIGLPAPVSWDAFDIGDDLEPAPEVKSVPDSSADITDAQSGGTGQPSEAGPSPQYAVPDLAVLLEADKLALSDLDNVLAAYLRSDEYELAWHLADLAEERGEPVALPAALIKALALGRAINRPGDLASAAVQGMLADANAAVEALEKLNDEPGADRARAVAFSAFLRPALFDPGQTARPFLLNLSMRGKVAPYAALGSSLGGLGFGVQLSIDDLFDLAGVERKLRAPAALAALRTWLDRARVAKTMHQPTYRIFREMLERGGDLGRVFESVLTGSSDAFGKAQEVLDRLIDDRVKQERFVAECERRFGRPRRDRIEGMALDWLCKYIQEGCERLRDWLVARENDAAQVDDRRRNELRAKVGQLKKLSEHLGDIDNAPERDLDAAVDILLHRAVADFHALLEGRPQPTPQLRAQELLERPLLRLPGGCQPWAGVEPAFDEERIRQRHHLLVALLRREQVAADYFEAVRHRLAENAVLAARDLIEILRGLGTNMETLAPFEQDVGDREASSREIAINEVDRIRMELSTLQNLELSAPVEVKKILDRLELIYEALKLPTSLEDRVTLPALNNLRDSLVPPDFPELRDFITEAQSFCSDRRERIRIEQRARLQRLTERPKHREAASQLLENIEALDPVTLDNMIGQVQAGLPVVAPDSGRTDEFSVFFPGFVEALVNAGPLNRGDIIGAVDLRARIGPLDFPDTMSPEPNWPSA